MIVSRKMIKHLGVNIQQVIQKNKGEGYSRYFLPSCGDKSAALKINGYLSKEEVEQLIGKEI